MSTRIAVMSAGEILQAAAPPEVYGNPTTLEVARYLGALNEFDVSLGSDHNGERRVTGGALTFAMTSIADDRQRARCGVRPEHVLIAATETSSCATPAKVQAAIFGADWTRVQLVAGGLPALPAVLPHGGPPVAEGGRVWIAIEGDRAMLVDESSGARLK